MKALKYVLLILLVLLVFNGFYVLPETKQAIITQFGDPVRVVTNAGLHIKIPLIQKLHLLEKRILEWDGEPKQIPTSDKKYIWIDTFARWQINDPLKFYQTTRTENGGQSRLDDIIDGTARDIVTLYPLIEVVRNSNREMQFAVEREDLEITEYPQIEVGREAIEDSVLARASISMQKFGMNLIDVKIKRINYIEEVRAKVYERMISERKKIAARYRSEGQGKAAEISGKTRRELDEITSEAYRQAQEIMGQADAEATRIYAEAYKKDASFFQLFKTLEAYKNTLDTKNTLIISTDSDFYKFLKSVK